MKSSQGRRERGSASLSNCTPTPQTTSTKSTGPHDRAFQQNLIDHRIYPYRYQYPDGKTPPPPRNLEDIAQYIKRRRRSLSPSRFSLQDFRRFQQADADAFKEGQVMSSVVPFIEGEAEDGRCVCGNIPLTNLESLMDGLLVPGNPDRYYGARPEQLDQRVRAELSRHIVPSTQHDLPIVPNFFVAVKGPDGSLAVAERQACYDGVLGARGIYSLQRYGDEELVPNNKAYAITCTYHGGQLKMYTSHLLPPVCTGGPYEYIMRQIKAYALTSDVETFRAGAAAYRNARDWAKWQRDEAISRANEKVRQDMLSVDRRQVRRTRRAGDLRPSSLTNSDTSADELALDMTLVNRPPRVKRFRRAGDLRPTSLGKSDTSADELALEMPLVRRTRRVRSRRQGSKISKAKVSWAMDAHEQDDADNPVQWGVDRIVRELCTAKGSHRLYKDGALPANFGQRLRHNGIDGSQLVRETRTPERQDLFFKAMGIDSFAQQTFLLNIINKLQAESERSDCSNTEHLVSRKEKPDGRQSLSNTPDSKKRRIQPQPMTSPNAPTHQRQRDAHGYCQDGGLQSFDILHHDHPGAPTADEVCEFSILPEPAATPTGHQLQLARSDRLPRAPRRQRHRADTILALSHPLNDPVLPIYGESDQEYDTDTWDEIQEEMEERRHSPCQHKGLATGEIDAVLDNVVRRYESDWRNETVQRLQDEAFSTWRQLHRDSSTTIRDFSQNMRKMDERITAMRRGLMEAGPYYSELDVSRRAKILQPSVRDRLKTRWLLHLARQKNEPKKAASPSLRSTVTATGNAGQVEDSGTDSGEDLHSDPDHQSYQASSSNPSTPSRNNMRRHQEAPLRPQVILISDDDSGDELYPPPPASEPAAPDTPVGPTGLIDLTDELDEDQADDALVDLDTQSEKEIWSFACLFSGHDPAATDPANPGHHHRFQGLAIALRPHQLWAVTRLLFTYHFEKVFGVLLADGMGVGKTLESSCGAILASHIRLASADVKLDRKHNYGRHLPASTPSHRQAPHSHCPSGTYVRGFACPCVERLPTAQLLASGNLPMGPTVILVPPGLREQWYQQLCKYIPPGETQNSVRRPDIWSIHTQAEKITSTMRQKYPRVKFLAASELCGEEITDDQWAWQSMPTGRALLTLGGRKKGDTSHIIMVMPASSALTGIQKESSLYVERDGSDVLETFFIKPGWVIIDEAHNQITETTIVWQFIEKLLCRATSPTHLISASGTPIRRSPWALKPFINIVTSRAVRHWREPPRYDPRKDFDLWARESDWLVSHRRDADSANEGKRDAYQKRFHDCKLLGRKVLKPYMIQRHSHYKFLGFPVVPLPMMCVELIQCSEFPAAYFEEIRNLISMSRQQLNERLEKKLVSWRALNSSNRGPQPTMEDVISEMDKGFGRFYDLGLCATFPALAKMLLSGRPPRFRSQDIDCDLNAMSDADLRSHPLWPHKDMIKTGSQKMDFIIQKIQDMQNDDERHKDVASDRNILRKKMIIFALSPVTAFLIAFILRHELPRTRQKLVLARNPPSKRGVLYGPFCRSTDEEVLEDRDPNDPLILVTTTGVAGEGFNLTRANYVILAEPAFSKQVEDQAFHRIHRYGQQATTHLFSLYSSWNPAERIVRSRQDVRSSLFLDESVWMLPGAEVE
ncbi:hypothetical protein F4678DRAFT_455696 [Xylaria arbuscula]|nr:hypothetical protein F4678DRAFT_455696 [Xylaria arbuscula]